MSVRRFLTGASLLAAVTICGPAQASTIFQGVEFTFEDVGSNTLRLTIDDAVSGGTSNWANINFFDAFDIRDVGSFSGATATYAAIPQSEGGELGEQVTGSPGQGCKTGGGASACFDWTPNLALTNHMVIDIAFTLGLGDVLDLSNPHLKVAFLINDNDRSAQGSLFSQNVASEVPGPIVGAGLPGLVAACFGLIALARRRRSVEAVTA